jgi:hypothetical protein
MTDKDKHYASADELKEVDELERKGDVKGALALVEALFRDEQDHHARLLAQAEDEYKRAFSDPNVEDMYAGMNVAVVAASAKNSKEVLERLARIRAMK